MPAMIGYAMYGPRPMGRAQLDLIGSMPRVDRPSGRSALNSPAAQAALYASTVFSKPSDEIPQAVARLAMLSDAMGGWSVRMLFFQFETSWMLWSKTTHAMPSGSSLMAREM